MDTRDEDEPSLHCPLCNGLLSDALRCFRCGYIMVRRRVLPRVLVQAYDYPDDEDD